MDSDAAGIIYAPGIILSVLAAFPVSAFLIALWRCLRRKKDHKVFWGLGGILLVVTGGMVFENRSLFLLGFSIPDNNRYKTHGTASTPCGDPKQIDDLQKRGIDPTSLGCYSTVVFVDPRTAEQDSVLIKEWITWPKPKGEVSVRIAITPTGERYIYASRWW